MTASMTQFLWLLATMILSAQQTADFELFKQKYFAIERELDRFHYVSDSLGIQQRQFFLNRTSDHRIKTDIYNANAYQTVFRDPDSAMTMANFAYDLSKRTDYEAGQYRAHFIRGIISAQTGLYRDASRYFIAAIQVARSMRDPEAEGLVYLRHGQMKDQNGEYIEAYELYTRSRQLFAEVRSQYNRLDAMLHIGRLFTTLEINDQALHLLREVFEQSNTRAYDKLTHQSYLALATLYSSMGDDDEADRQLSNATLKANRMNDSELIGISYFERARLYLKRGNLDLAEDELTYAYQKFESIGFVPLDYFEIYADIKTQKKLFDAARSLLQRGLRIAITRSSRNAIAIFNMKLGLLEHEAGNTRTAIEYLKVADGIARQLNTYSLLSTITEGLSDCYASVNEFDQAFRFQKQYVIYVDSVKSRVERRRLANIQLSQRLQARQAELRTENETNRTVNMVMIALVVVLLGLVIFVILYFRRNEKTDRLELAERTAKIGYWEYQIKSERLYMSQTAKVIFELPEDVDPDFHTLSDFFYSSDQISFENLVHDIIQNRIETTTVLKISLRSYQIKWLRVSARYSEVHDNQVDKVFGVFQDITDQKKYEDELRQADERYRAFIENSSEAIWRLECNTIFTIDSPKQQQLDMLYRNFLVAECNDQFAQLYGFTKADDIIGRNFSELTPLTDELFSNNTNFIESDYKIEGTLSREITPSGEERYFINNLHAEIKENRLINIWGTKRDITERRRYEMALIEADKRYQNFIRNSSEAIWRLELEHPININSERETLAERILNEVYIAEGNNSFAEMYNAKSLDQLVGRKVASFKENYDTNLSVYREFVKREFRVMNRVTLEIDQIGNEKYLLNNFYGEIQDDMLVRIWGTQRDITIEKLSEIALRKSEELFRNIFEYSPIGLVLFTADGKILNVNQSFVRFVGYDEYDIYDMTFENFFNHDNYEKIKNRIGLCLNNLIQSFEIETKFINYQNQEKWALLSANLHTDEDGSPEFFITQIVDINDRKKSEEENDLLIKTVRSKNEELESIVYVTSHDLRSPLVNIQGFSKEISHSVDDLVDLIDALPDTEQKSEMKVIMKEDIMDSINFIQTSSSKMDQLLKGLLKLSRLGRIELEIIKIDMNSMLKQIIDAVQFRLNEIDAEVTVKDLHPVMGDMGQINQVFTNLVDNAIKYRDPARKLKIEIWSEEKSDMIEYHVKDNGMGVAENHQKKVFELFHRLDPKSQIQGEGLGLTIIRRILDRHFGKITLVSDAGKGCDFSVHLPKKGDQ